MAIGSTFREFGRFLDDCERGEREVTVLEITECPGSNRAPALSADLEVVLPPGRSDGTRPAIELTSPRVGPDGTLRFAVESVDSLLPTEAHDVGIEPTGGSVGPDGSITVSLTATASGEGSDEGGRLPADGHRRSNGRERSGGIATNGTSRDGTDGAAEGTSENESDTGADSDLPPFKNPELLRSIFESHDTFAEMAEAIDMDVTAETVRRYMIDYDIHQPNTYKTRDADDETADDAATVEADIDTRQSGDDASDPSHEIEETGDEIEVEGARDKIVVETDVGTDSPQQPVVISDGIGLPDDVTVDTLIDTVKRSNTLYEVTRKLDIDRQAALEMLEQLNLLDLVVGRMATEGERDIGRNEVIERLRRASATS